MHSAGTTITARVTIDGRFFRCGDRKFHPKGVTYGPFAPDAQGLGFPDPGRVQSDFRLARDLGANLVRVYEVPPRWLLDLAQSHQLKVFVDIPWPKDLCFLETEELRQAAISAVRHAAATGCGHPALFAYSVANEIPAQIVRWYGARRVAGFLDQLIRIARQEDPGCLCTFASFPTTEFLRVRQADFVCFNVFLESRPAYEQYLARLQVVAGDRPLVIGECGLDGGRAGEARQAETLAWLVDVTFRAGAAGVVVFSLTDDWYRGGGPVRDWAFGLTDAGRVPKPAFRAVQQVLEHAPYFLLTRTPRVSVVVACHNGAATLRACLDSLTRLHYPNYEILLVDDGSTDETAQIAASFTGIGYVRQTHLGLSAARNAGIAAATGEIIAFTDADCRADDDWLYYLAGELLREGVSGVGGPNLLPPDDSRVAAAVMASPGGPTHVMLTDREAEHIPGCNMAFWRSVLVDVGGFDPVFHRAGDDVDLCWRVLERGGRIVFSPAAFVWHYRRSTPVAYLRQQSGYGEAEALLARKHPEGFNALGGGLWRGRIYAAAPSGIRLRRPVIYQGVFGTALFQRLYEPAPDAVGALFTSLEYHALVTLPLLVLSLVLPSLLPLAVGSLLLAVAVVGMASVQAELPPGKEAWWSRPLVALLSFLQPIVRGWARYRWRFTARSVRPTTFRRSLTAATPALRRARITLSFWNSGGVDRFQLLRGIFHKLQREGWEWRPDSGWAGCDAEISGRRWSRIRMTTVAEDLGAGHQTLHCRLQGGWTLSARWSVGAAGAAMLTAQAFLGPSHRWVLFGWLILPVLVAAIGYESRLVLRLLAALVDESAADLQLLPLSARPADVQTAPPVPARDALPPGDGAPGTG